MHALTAYRSARGHSHAEEAHRDHRVPGAHRMQLAAGGLCIKLNGMGTNIRARPTGPMTSKPAHVAR